MDSSKMSDELVASSGFGRSKPERSRIVGFGVAEVRGPDGAVKQRVEFHNLITDRGDEYYANLGAGEIEDLATGMRLGTSNASPSKGGAGAAIGNYVSGSNTAFESVNVSDKGAGDGHRITYVAEWGAGVATEDGIVEAVITNEDPLTDVAGNAGNTIARALLSPVVNKGPDDTLTFTWHHDFQGS
jgi:hypothetical protein